MTDEPTTNTIDSDPDIKLANKDSKINSENVEIKLKKQIVKRPSIRTKDIKSNEKEEQFSLK